MILVLIIASIYVASSFYKVDAKERAVVTRFGKFLRVDGPGPHFAFKPFDKFQKVDVTSLNETQVSGETAVRRLKWHKEFVRLCPRRARTALRPVGRRFSGAAAPPHREFERP